jgi:hypothetical protein
VRFAFVSFWLKILEAYGGVISHWDIHSISVPLGTQNVITSPGRDAALVA